MADKHIFIGLGGAGVNVVSLLKYKIYSRTSATALQSRLEVMGGDYRFMFVDTDKRDVERYNELYRSMYEGGRDKFINDAELVNLGDQNPRFIRNSANSTPERQLSRRTIEACPDVVTESMDDKELTFGAGALRLKSRIAFSRKEGDFRTMLLNNARALNRVDANGGRNVIHYWVVASSNGGTGSGTVHDVLYMVNMVHRSQIHDSDQKVGLVLFMPRFYINVNQSNERYPRNAYAVFSELSALQGGAKSRSMNKLFHRLAMIDEYNLFNPNTAYRPFQFCIPVDYQTADNNNMGSQDNMYSNAAEMLYYIHSGAGAGGFDSFVNNYEDGEKVWPSDCFLIPMGYRAIRKPNDEFDNYMSLRIKYEFLRYGIIGEGVEDSSVRKEAARVLFDSVIKKMLFSGGDPESYFSKVAARAAEKLEEEMPQNMILNSKGKVVSQLPQTVGIESTRSLITDIKAMMARMEPEKKQTRKLLESKLWCWVEDTARTWGLKYVLDILLEVDAMCTDIYQSYNTDTRMENLVGIGNSRSSLIANRDGIEKELDDLRNKAMHVSVSEFLGGNGDDVKAFYDRLVDWVNACIGVEIGEASFKMLYELSYGDQGVIDDIISHVRRLLAQATVALDGDKGASTDYKALARTFLNKRLDVTSVYVPDITKYVDGHGWIETGNLFSEWYGRVVGKSDKFVENEGFAPLRNGDSKKSLDAFIGDMVAGHKDQMIQQGYWVVEGEKGRSRLFTNTSKSNCLKVIEDLLGYAADTIHEKLLQDSEVAEHWYRKSLAQFVQDLDMESRQAIQDKSNPTLFYPYLADKEGHVLPKKSFCVGPQGVMQQVFKDDGNTSYLETANPDEMYKISTVLGLSLRSYDMYDSIKAEYDKCENKVFYHFHKAFADAGGVAERIRLPKETRPELIVFAKYLLADKLKKYVGDLMWKSDSQYDADNFAKTPVIMTPKTVKFATIHAISLVDEDRIALRKTDGENDYYTAKAIEKADQRFTEMLEAFIDEYAVGQFGKLINEYIKDVKYLDSDLLQRKYSNALAELKASLNEYWAKAKAAGKKREQATLADILTVLDKKLNTVDKFISSSLWS